MELRRTGAKASATVSVLVSLAVLLAGADAYSKHCAHVRGYNDGTVTVRAMTCHRAARILRQAREGNLDVSGFHCTRKSAYPRRRIPALDHMRSRPFRRPRQRFRRAGLTLPPRRSSPSVRYGFGLQVTAATAGGVAFGATWAYTQA